mgnify:CR=1 FL=1
MKKLETDTKILKKNLELTKALQDVDRLKSELVDKAEVITELQKHIIELTDQKCDDDDLPF